MRAAVYARYGSPDVVHLEDVAKPAPGDDEILVRVRATTVTAGDSRLRRADPFLARIFNGLSRPKKVTILGFELAGVVDAVGKDVQRFRPGDEVFAFTGFGFGGHADYCCLRMHGKIFDVGLVSLKPGNLSFEQAAAMPVGALTARAFLRLAGLRSGERILVHGASGSVGTYAVQLAKQIGANVTAVCSAPNAALVESLGADAVIDYTTRDFTAEGPVFDVVFDAAGKCKSSLGKRALKKGGRFVSVMGSAKFEADDLDELAKLAQAGKLTAVIDRTYPLEDIVEAHRYVDAGHKKGNVVVTVA